MTNETKQAFTGYEIFIITILALAQFTIVLDFMVMNPLSAFLLEEMNLNTRQFGGVVSAYAYSAGASGFLASFFADRFDRKRLLMFFYTGFIIGTLLCGLATNYHFLLSARIVTGIFGGVIGSVSFAIITDLFAFQVRGRVMGFVQMAFASSQVIGLPVGLMLANKWGWHMPFFMIVGVATLTLLAILVKMRPVNAHLSLQGQRSVGQHMLKVVSNRQYLRVFFATTLLATGGYMLMPFGAAFAVGNLGISKAELSIVYFVTGLCSMVAGPLIGKLADRVGAFKVFAVGSAITIATVLIYTNLGITPLWLVTAISAVMMAAVASRIITSSTINSAVPDQVDRGTFMGINSSVAQVSGGIASTVAGMIVFQNENGFMEHYPTLGFVVTAAMAITTFQFWGVNKMLHERRRQQESSIPELKK